MACNGNTGAPSSSVGTEAGGTDTGTSANSDANTRNNTDTDSAVNGDGDSDADADTDTNIGTDAVTDTDTHDERDTCLAARPFGPGAPWNIPVAGLPVHPESGSYSALLWNDSPADRAGNFNLSFDGYTYPVYELTGSEAEVTVEINSRFYRLTGVEEVADGPHRALAFRPKIDHVPFKTQCMKPIRFNDTQTNPTFVIELCNLHKNHLLFGS